MPASGHAHYLRGLCAVAQCRCMRRCGRPNGSWHCHSYCHQLTAMAMALFSPCARRLDAIMLAGLLLPLITLRHMCAPGRKPLHEIYSRKLAPGAHAYGLHQHTHRRAPTAVITATAHCGLIGCAEAPRPLPPPPKKQETKKALSS